MAVNSLDMVQSELMFLKEYIPSRVMILISQKMTEADGHVGLWKIVNLFRSSAQPLDECYVNADAFLIARSSFTRNETMRWLAMRNENVDLKRWEEALEGEDVGAQCGRHLLEADYYFSEILHSCNQHIDFDDWLDKMRQARDLSIAYENFFLHYSGKANSEKSRHFDTYIYTSCMECVFGVGEKYDENGHLIPKETCMRRRFISFICHIFYVGCGIEAEKFLKVSHLNWKYPEAFHVAKRTGAYDVLPISGSITEEMALIFEADLINVLSELCDTINKQRSYFSRIASALLDDQKMVTIMIGRCFAAFEKLLQMYEQRYEPDFLKNKKK